MYETRSFPWASPGLLCPTSVRFGSSYARCAPTAAGGTCFSAPALRARRKLALSRAPQSTRGGRESRRSGALISAALGLCSCGPFRTAVPCDADRGASSGRQQLPPLHAHCTRREASYAQTWGDQTKEKLSPGESLAQLCQPGR